MQYRMMDLRADADSERQATMAARTTWVLFALAWSAILLFSFVWDCAGSCIEQYGRLLASMTVGALTMLPAGALILLGSFRLERRLRGGRWNAIGRTVLLLGSVAGFGLMAAAFLLACYANAGAMDRLSLIPWLISSVMGAFVIAVYAAIVGAGSWQAATAGRKALS